MGLGIMHNISVCRFFLMMPVILFVILLRGTKVVWFCEEKNFFLNDKAILGQIIDIKKVDKGIEVNCISEAQDAWKEIIYLKENNELSRRLLSIGRIIQD